MGLRTLTAILIAAGGLAGVLGTVASVDDVTVRMTAGMAYGIALVILAISMWIIRPARTGASQ